MKAARITRKTCLGCGCDLSDRRCGGGLSFCLACRKERGARVQSALNKVRRAIRRGDLPHPNTLQCADCGVPAEVYDHRDYLKPLEVVPVCKSCNICRGPAKVNKRVGGLTLERRETRAYRLLDKDSLGGVEVEMDDKEYAYMRSVFDEFGKVQERLAELYGRKE